MEDSELVSLFWERKEEAISACSARYGAMCQKAAGRILSSPEDAEECVSDALLRAWNAIPPERPQNLAAYLLKITRNLALDRWRKQHRQKRLGSETALCLEELEETLPAEDAIADRVVLKDSLNRFLRGLSDGQRTIFLLRFWHFLPVKEIARRTGKSAAMVKSSLRRTREALREYLKQEGYDV